MKNDDALVENDNGTALSDEELERIYEQARRLAVRPRVHPPEAEDPGLMLPWWLLLGMAFAGIYIALVILLLLVVPALSGLAG